MTKQDFDRIKLIEKAKNFVEQQRIKKHFGNLPSKSIILLDTLNIRGQKMDWCIDSYLAREQQKENEKKERESALLFKLQDKNDVSHPAMNYSALYSQIRSGKGLIELGKRLKALTQSPEATVARVD